MGLTWVVFPSVSCQILQFQTVGGHKHNHQIAIGQELQKERASKPEILDKLWMAFSEMVYEEF